MSLKTELVKKVHKSVNKATQKIRKQAMIDLSREMLTMPLKQRLKLSMKILFQGKL